MKTKPVKPLDRHPRTRDEGRDVATRFLLTEPKATNSLRKAWKQTRDSIIEVPKDAPLPMEHRIARKLAQLNFRQLVRRSRRALKRVMIAHRILRRLSPESRFYKPVAAQKDIDVLTSQSALAERLRRRRGESMDCPRGDEPNNLNAVTGTSS